MSSVASEDEDVLWSNPAVQDQQIDEMRAELLRLRSIVADLLPYAVAGADALDLREPYGDAWRSGNRAAHEALCDGAWEAFNRFRNLTEEMKDRG